MESLSEDKAWAFLETEMVAHIGVIDDGAPYVTPMSFVLDDKRVLFRTKPGRRLSAIRDNPVVSIEVSRFDESGGDWTSVIVRGEARLTDDDDTTQLVLSKLFDKYREVLGSPLGRGGGMQPMASLPHVVEVEVHEITGMTSSGPFSMRTRPGRL